MERNEKESYEEAEREEKREKRREKRREERMEQRELRNRYKEAVGEWKQQYKEVMKDWKERMEEWKNLARSSMREGHLPPLPPLPTTIPLPFVPSMSRTRSNVVASRIGDEELNVIDMLIEAGLFSTRSKAAAYLVSEGVKARSDIVDRVSSTLEEIRRIRKEAQEHVIKLRRDVGLEKTEEVVETAEPEELREPEETVETGETEEPVEQKRSCHRCGRDLTNLPEDINVCPYCGVELRRQEEKKRNWRLF